MKKEEYLNHRDEIFDCTKRCFIRVIKDKNFYPRYRTIMKNWMKEYLKQEKPVHQYNVALAYCFSTLKARVNNDFTKHPNKTPYEYVTICINYLLHDIADTKMRINPRILGHYGQEIFDMTCYSLFPDDYSKDMKVLEELKPNDEFTNFSMHIFNQVRANDERFRKMSFNEFFESHKDVLQHEFDAYNKQEFNEEDTFFSDDTEEEGDDYIEEDNDADLIPW